MGIEDVPHEVRAVLEAIAEERTRQLAVWGVQHLPNGTAASKANRAKRDSFRKITEWNAQRHTLTWDHVATEEVLEARAEDDLDALETELIQTAAVYCAWIEDVRRQKNDQA